MRLRNTLILALLLIALGGYLWFVERPRIAEEAEKDTLVELEPEQATALTLTYSDRELVLEKGDAGWRLTQPIEAPADDVTVTNLLRTIADAEVKKTIEEAPADLTPFGLAPPVVTVVVTAAGRTLPALKVGKTTAVSASTYVQRGDQPAILLTGSGFQTSLDKQPKDLRDKKIVEFKDDDVTNIALRGPQGAIALKKQDGGWTIQQPGTYTADPNAVRALLSTVRNLRATDFANDAPNDADLATYGLVDPPQELVLRTADGAAITLLLGSETEDGVYVKAGDKTTVFVVGKWVATDLSKGVNDLRDKTLLSFDPEVLGTIEVARRGGAPFTLTRAGEAWSVSGIEGADTPAIESFVGALSRLAGNQIVADAPADLGEYGLADPLLTITVKDAQGAGLGTVRIGSHAPNPPATEYTGMRADDPTVFQLRDFQFTQLDKSQADFAPPPATAASGSAP